MRERIQMTRFLLICGVVVLHTPPYMPLAEVGSDPFDLLRAYFQLALFRISVPLLSAIAGYLLFQSALDRAPAALLANKARSIVLPFLLWNVPLAVLVYHVQAGGGLPSANPWLPGADPEAWLLLAGAKRPATVEPAPAV